MRTRPPPAPDGLRTRSSANRSALSRASSPAGFPLVRKRGRPGRRRPKPAGFTVWQARRGSARTQMYVRQPVRYGVSAVALGCCSWTRNELIRLGVSRQAAQQRTVSAVMVRLSHWLLLLLLLNRLVFVTLTRTILLSRSHLLVRRPR